MNTYRLGWIMVVAAGLIGTAAAQSPQSPQKQPPPTSPQPTATPQKPVQKPGQPVQPRTGVTRPMVQDPAVIKDVENTLGFVPVFIRMVPPALLPSFWMSLKNFQMSNETKLDGKTKELIGLAVAAQIPCEYCVIFHTEAARMNGATDVEIQEAVGMAAVTRQASTMINGMMIDKAQFKRDTDRIMRRGKQQARK